MFCEQKDGLVILKMASRVNSLVLLYSRMMLKQPYFHFLCASVIYAYKTATKIKVR